MVRSEFASCDVWHPQVLRRVDGDAAIDIVCLSIFWHKPADQTTEHPLKNLCRDLIFCATRVGQGIDLEVERFKRKVDEDKKKDVMGQSAWRYALDMQAMTRTAESTRDGKSDVELIASILATNRMLAKDWKADTCARYLQVGNKISNKAKKILSRWELAFQRNVAGRHYPPLLSGGSVHKARRLRYTCGGALLREGVQVEEAQGPERTRPCDRRHEHHVWHLALSAFVRNSPSWLSPSRTLAHG